MKFSFRSEIFLYVRKSRVCSSRIRECLRPGASAGGRFDPGTEDLSFLDGECAAHHIFDEVGGEGCLRVCGVRRRVQRALAAE